MKFINKRGRSAEDIEYIKKSQLALEAAMQAVVDYLLSAEDPRSEKAHKLIDDVLTVHGCESPEGHIVAGGTASAEPHEIGSGLLKAGVPIVIDIYPRHKETGFFADMTRTVCLGEPSAELQKMYAAVLEAQELALSMVRPGVKGVDIQKAVEEYFDKKGYQTSGKGTEFSFAEGFVHGVGHGVGKDIHERPYLGRNSQDVLNEGDVITIEPGLYYRHLGGVRLEDMVLVTTVGHQNLSNFPKQFGL